MIKVHEIGGYVVRNYVLETPSGHIAIDTGYPGGMEKYAKRFARIAPLPQLKYIFLTHSHDDHAGFLGELLACTNAQVVLHPAAVPVLAAGENQQPPGAGYSSRLAAGFGLFKKDFTFPPVDVAGREILVQQGGQQVFKELGLPLQILYLPGHTADSIGLLNEEDGVLYCGDAAMNAVISLKRHTIWIDDSAQSQKSWDVMLAAKPARIVPAHGNPFSPEDLHKYRHYLDGCRMIAMK